MFWSNAAEPAKRTLLQSATLHVSDGLCLRSVQLPLRNLGLALDKMPPKIAVQAAEFVASGRAGPLPRQTTALIQERAAAAQAPTKTTEPI